MPAGNAEVTQLACPEFKATSVHEAIVMLSFLKVTVPFATPAADITRLLKERPDIVGLAVPGMPVGSPGMEAPDGHAASFDVIAFDKAGKTRVFASHR